jgi:hypothetical protein
VGCCECGNEPLGSGTMELVSFSMMVVLYDSGTLAIECKKSTLIVFVCYIKIHICYTPKFRSKARKHIIMEAVALGC